jgi:hypothetical protein
MRSSAGASGLIAAGSSGASSRAMARMVSAADSRWNARLPVIS